MTIVNDTEVEGNETFVYEIASISIAASELVFQVDTPMVTIVIVDDDAGE